MGRCWSVLLLGLIAMWGCGKGNTTGDSVSADATDAAADSSSVDGSTDGSTTHVGTTDGESADGTAVIVTPTEDDSDQRAKAREMSVADLVSALGDAELSDAASDELVSRGPDAVKPLIDALNSSNPTVQQRAIFTLGQLGPAAKDALPKLQELAEDSNSEVIQDSAKYAIAGVKGE